MHSVNTAKTSGNIYVVNNRKKLKIAIKKGERLFAFFILCCLSKSVNHFDGCTVCRGIINHDR